MGVQVESRCTLNWREANIATDTSFVTGPLRNCYLGQTAARQRIDCPREDAAAICPRLVNEYVHDAN